MKLIDWFKNKKQLIDENSKIRKGKENVECKLRKLLEQLDEMQKKYINILEEKSGQFDLYIKYQNQCENLIKEKKELKKQFAEKNEKYNLLNESNDLLTKQNEKLSRKIKRMENKNEKSA